MEELQKETIKNKLISENEPLLKDIDCKKEDLSPSQIAQENKDIKKKKKTLKMKIK